MHKPTDEFYQNVKWVKYLKLSKSRERDASIYNITFRWKGRGFWVQVDADEAKVILRNFQLTKFGRYHTDPDMVAYYTNKRYLTA